MTEKPKNYIVTKWEYRKGFKFKQPYDYCNGIKITSETIANFKKIFGVDFTSARKESYLYNSTLVDCNYKSELWKDEKTKNKAFDKIHLFNINGKSGSSSSTTALFPFEIFLLNDGFEMLSFCELNAINSGVQIIADKFVNDAFINPTGIKYNRCYNKKDNFIYVAFGIEINNKKTNFYFQTTKSNYTFQVDNNIDNYKQAINGKLKPLELVFSEA